MAHFAKLGLDNVVLAVERVDDSKAPTEAAGIAHLSAVHGHELWKQCSYNTHLNTHKLSGTPLRANYPSAGGNWYYDSTNNIFHTGRPKDKDGQSCTSWTMNTTTGLWSSPIARPNETDAEVEAGKVYKWDESVYQGNNSLGWVLVDT